MGPLLLNPGSAAAAFRQEVTYSEKNKTQLLKDDIVAVRDGHGGGWSRKINAWHLYTLMVYL
jgi:hypothetical protein